MTVYDTANRLATEIKRICRVYRIQKIKRQHKFKCRKKAKNRRL